MDDDEIIDALRASGAVVNSDRNRSLWPPLPPRRFPRLDEKLRRIAARNDRFIRGSFFGGDTSAALSSFEGEVRAAVPFIAALTLGFVTMFVALCWIGDGVTHPAPIVHPAAFTRLA